MKRNLLTWMIIGWALCVSGQEMLTGLNSNALINKLYQQQKSKKSTQFIYYESIALPFIDDFSDYSGYPDTNLWIGRQAYVNEGFAYRPPTIGVVTLDALDDMGKVYDHASVMSFHADTLLSRPIRTDSLFSPLVRAIDLSDSIYFSFFYQPGGGIGHAWEGLGNAPEVKDSLILEFGYQTGNRSLLYYITDLMTIADTIIVGDTIISSCNTDLYIIANQNYYPGDVVEVPCDSVVGMEVIWEEVWSSGGMTLTEFESLYGTYCRQVMIPILDKKYLNCGFQFRFRNIASLEYELDAPTWASNVDNWNIDYVRLDRTRSQADTVIDDVAIVENPGSVLKNYTAMPWSHFNTNPAGFLKSSYDIKLTNLYNVTKNTTYEHQMLDGNGNQIGYYSGGSYNIDPFYRSGYQDYAPHAQPTISTISFPSVSNDSLLMTVNYIFKEAGSGDVNLKNDTATYLQYFYNYFAYDDGIPESGYIVTSSVSPYKTACALEFSLSHADSLRAVKMYFNRAYDDANNLSFTLTVWGDNAHGDGPGEVLYEQVVEQEYSSDIYGLQHFQLKDPVAVSGKFYIGYQTSNKRFLNVGFDQNNDASAHVFYRTSGNTWYNSFIVGSPIMRPVVGQAFKYTHIADDIAIPVEVELYPNPANHQLNIIAPAEHATMEIFTIHGQKIYSGPMQSQIDVSQYPSGFYILKLTDNHEVVAVKKFIVNR